MHLFIRSFFSLTIVLGLCIASFAQPPGGAPRGAAPAIGKVYGKVIDASTGKPAEFATVSVNMARGDSLLGGTIVRTNGDFLIEKLPLAPLKVTVSFIGYKAQVVEVTLSRDRMERDLGNNEFCFGKRFTLADIAAGYALAYLDYALPDVEWRSTHPVLAKLATRLATRPAFTNNGHASSR